MPKRRPKAGQRKKRPAGQTSLLQYGIYREREAERVKKKVKKAHEAAEEASIVIPYRDDGRVRGAGAFFDHCALQRIAKTPTTVLSLPADELGEGEAPQRVHLGEYMRNQATYHLPHGVPADDGVKEPPILSRLEDTEGLLFIPGLPRSVKEGDRDVLKARIDTHVKVIMDAMLKGKPILAVCAGSWSLWAAFRGRLRHVKDHNCNAGSHRER